MIMIAVSGLWNIEQVARIWAYYARVLQTFAQEIVSAFTNQTYLCKMS